MTSVPICKVFLHMGALFMEKAMEMDINALMGATLTSIDGAQKDSECVTFATTDGSRFVMRHYQECCEEVSLADVSGDVADLIGSPILEAEKVTNEDDETDYYSSWTWTFYKLGTIKGAVTFRWFGESNGYYSEDVSFEKLA